MQSIKEIVELSKSYIHSKTLQGDFGEIAS